MATPAPACGGATKSCSRTLALLQVLAAACALAACTAPAPPGDSTSVHPFPSPSSAERYCAWYGDARDGVLYFGQSAFWSAMRVHGDDPTADLLAEGPVGIGRFDLRRELPREALQAGAGGDRSGVWDVLAHPNGRVYFTTYFESAGYVDPASGRSVRLPGLGAGLNELALGPSGSIVASRYGSDSGAQGSVVLFDEAGSRIAEHPLAPPPGYLTAPKTVAYDPSLDQLWITTDLLPLDPAAPHRHDTYVLDAAGRELQRIATPEIQFVRFDARGTGYLAEVDGSQLWLRVIPPGGGADGGQRLALDANFATALDFVQDIQPLERPDPDGAPAEDDGVVVTRWSGAVHVVRSSGEVRTLQLPRLGDAGLYYTAVAEGDRICATHCADVAVVCRDAP